jgi:hypothetical protein
LRGGREVPGPPSGTSDGVLATAALGSLTAAWHLRYRSATSSFDSHLYSFQDGVPRERGNVSDEEAAFEGASGKLGQEP